MERHLGFTEVMYAARSVHGNRYLHVLNTITAVGGGHPKVTLHDRARRCRGVNPGQASQVHPGRETLRPARCTQQDNLGAIPACFPTLTWVLCLTVSLLTSPPPPKK